MKDLDRILSTDEQIEPRPGFAGRVMAAVKVENEAKVVPSGLTTLLAILFFVLVGAPILVLTVEGSLSVGGGDLSARMLWLLVVLVATAIAAALPLQLLED